MAHCEDIVKRLLRANWSNERVLYNYRPNWLINPKTGRALELDIYYPDLNIAVEVNGIHHQLDYQRYKDGVKDAICSGRGIKIYNIAITQKSLKKFIKLLNLETEGILYKEDYRRFNTKQPRKGSKLYDYYTETIKKLRQEGKKVPKSKTHKKPKYNKRRSKFKGAGAGEKAQRKEREANLKRMRAKGLVA